MHMYLVKSVIYCVGQLLDVPGGSRGSKHAPPVETWSEGSSEDHRGSRGQLP